MNQFYAEYESAQETITEATLINESNLAGHFNHYDDHQLINLLASGKKFLRLKDGIGYRCIEAEEISIQVAADTDFTIKLINLSIDGDTSIESVRKLVNDEIYRIISAELEQIKEDYEDLLNGI